MTEAQAGAPYPDLEGVPDDVRQRLGFVLGRRWFGGRTRSVTSVQCIRLPWLRAPVDAGGIATRVELLRLGYADGGTETYQLPLAYADGEIPGHDHAFVGVFPPDAGEQARHVYDAAHVREAATELIRPIAEGQESGGIIGHRVGDEIDLDAPPLALTAEQSNTSIVYGDSALLKLFRRVQPGHNPDITANLALTEARLGVAPDLLGWSEAAWPDVEETVTGDLSMVTTFLSSATDGWSQATASVRDLLAEGDLHADEVGGDFAAEIYRVGEATRLMHQGLQEAFGTSTWVQDDLNGLVERLSGRLANAVERVPDLAPFRQPILDVYASLTSLPDGVEVQRVHGDFHLGQTIRAISGWKVIDFEGEPGSEYAQRTVFDSRWRDVAGMLRSVDYAAKHLLVGTEPDRQERFRADEWGERNRAAYLAGYLAHPWHDAQEPDPGDKDPGDDRTTGTPPETAPDQPPAATPESGDDAHQILLTAYELDKAVYEVVYEASMRPDWIVIPLTALERLT